MRARWRDKYGSKPPSQQDPGSGLPVTSEPDFEDALDEAVALAGDDLFACNSSELPDHLREWELLSEADEKALFLGMATAHHVPPILPFGDSGGTAHLNIVDKSEPAASAGSVVFEHRAASAPAPVVSEALRLTEKKVLKFPWEKGRLGRIFGDVGRLEPKRPRLHAGSNNFVQMNLELSSGAKCEGTVTVEAGVYNPAVYVSVVKQMPGCSYAEERSSRRDHAIRQWWDLLRYDLKCSDPGRTATAEHGLLDVYKYGIEILDACFGLKSPNTLLKRLYAVKLFNQWLVREHGIFWLPLKESMVWAYLRNMREMKAPASRATSFLEAVRFCHFTMHTDGAAEVMDSLRVKGLASQLYICKKPWRPSDTLTVSEVEFLHECLVDPKRSDIDKVIVGHMLHLLYGRARHSDLLAVTHGFLDEEEAFLEVGAAVHKGARNMDTKAKLLPIVATAQGVRGGNWVKTYFQLRDRVGLTLPAEDPLPMLPAPGRVAGGWCERYLTSQELNRFIKQLFESSGRSFGSRKVTTHSFKATSLSWCAKHGVSGEHRAVLARHAGSVQGATVLYSRDIISAAMRSFVEVVGAIRSSLFHPDKTRSGMLTPAPATPAPLTPFVKVAANQSGASQVATLANAEVAHGDVDQEYSPGTPVEEAQVKLEVEWPDVNWDDAVIDVDAPGVLARPWDSDSESESDSTSSEEEDEQMPPLVPSELDQPNQMPPSSLRWFINAKTLVIHDRRDVTSFKCGRLIGPTYFAVPALNGLRCGKCFASAA